jgi:hypothetical protein
MPPAPTGPSRPRLEGEALEAVDDLDWRVQNDLYGTLAEN